MKIDNQDNPLVSLLIFSYNHELYIEDAIKSAFAQNYQNFEVLIRDDCSKDNSVTEIKKAIKKYNENNHIEVITDFANTNKGLMYSYNRLLELSKGEIIFGMGGDDIATNNRISRVVEVFTNYEIDLLATNAYVVDKNKTIIKPNFYSDNAFFSQFISTNMNNVLIAKNMNWKNALNFVLGGFSIVIKRSLLKEYKGYFPTTIIHEDDFSSFLAIMNKGALFINENLLYYRRHDTNLWKIFNSSKSDFLSKYTNYKIDFFNPLYLEKINYLSNYLCSDSAYFAKKKEMIKTLKIQIAMNNTIYNHFNKVPANKNITNLKVFITNIFSTTTTKVALKGLLYYLVPIYVKWKLIKQNKKS